MTLEVGRSRHNQLVHRAESVTPLWFGVVQARRERAAHTVTHRCLGCRDDTGDPARLQRVGNVTGFAGGVEAVLGTDVLIVESGQQHVEPKSRVESVGGTGSFNTDHAGVGEPLIEGVSEVLDPVRYGGRASSGPPAD